MNRITIDDVKYFGGDNINDKEQDTGGSVTVEFYYNINGGRTDRTVVTYNAKDGKVPYYVYDDSQKRLYLGYGVVNPFDGSITLVDMKTGSITDSDFYFGYEGASIGFASLTNILVDGSVINDGDGGCILLQLPFPVFDIDDIDGIKAYVGEGNRDGELIKKPNWTYWKFIVDNTTGLCKLTITCHPEEGYTADMFTNVITGPIAWSSTGNVEDEFLNMSFINQIGSSAFDPTLHLQSTIDGSFVMANTGVTFSSAGVGTVKHADDGEDIHDLSYGSDGATPPNIVEFIQTKVDDNTTPRY